MSAIVEAHDFHVIPFSVFTAEALTGFRIYTVHRVSKETIFAILGAYVEYREQGYELSTVISICTRDAVFWPLDDVAEYYNYLFLIHARLVGLNEL